MNAVIIGRRLLLAVIFALTFACGSREGDDGASAGEPWPLTIREPAVLGYVATGRLADQADMQATVASSLEWQPAGLAPERPALLLLLDAMVLGGPLALLLPVDDAAAFDRSLQASPLVTPLEEGRVRVSLPPTHPVIQLLRAAPQLTGADSPLDVIEALGKPAALQFSLTIEHRSGFVLLVPSYEAKIVARHVLEQVPGLFDPPVHDALVLSLDIERIKDAFDEELQGLEDRLSSLLLGAQVAGLGGMFVRAMADEEQEALPRLPFNGPFAWALLEMSGARGIRAARLDARGFADIAALASRGAVEDLAVPFDLALTLRLPDGADRAGVLGTLRSTPPVASAISFAVDGEGFGPAVAAWARPLAELTMGKGPPAQAYERELATLLAPWSGRMALFPGGEGRAAALVVALRSGTTFDIEAARAWFERLAHAGGLEVDVDALAEDAGDVLDWWIQDDALVVTGLGQDPAIVDRQLSGFLESRLRDGPAGGPFLHWKDDLLDLTSRLGRDDRLVFELHFTPRGDS